jgi:hypothetical protein
MWIAGDGKEREDISHCFKHFPQFEKDFPALFDEDEGVIKRIDFDHYEWTKEETSLAEYFNWLKRIAEHDKPILKPIRGGFWAPITTVFRINKKSLRNLASRYSNSDEPSNEFKEIKKMVLQYREKIKQQKNQERKDKKTFAAIKTLIDKADGGDIKEIRVALEKIKTTLT